MNEIKKIPTSPIPDGYYEQHWSLEGAILRDKINEIINFINNKTQQLENDYNLLLEDYKRATNRNCDAIDYLHYFSSNSGALEFPFNKIQNILMGGK